MMMSISLHILLRRHLIISMRSKCIILLLILKSLRIMLISSWIQALITSQEAGWIYHILDTSPTLRCNFLALSLDIIFDARLSILGWWNDVYSTLIVLAFLQVILIHPLLFFFEISIIAVILMINLSWQIIIWLLSIFFLISSFILFQLLIVLLLLLHVLLLLLLFILLHWDYIIIKFLVHSIILIVSSEWRYLMSWVETTNFRRWILRIEIDVWR